MRGLFWNSEGFRDLGKQYFVKETIKDKKLDFVALSETGRSNFSTPFLSNLAVGFDFSWFCLPPRGRSGGMLIGINIDTLQVKNVDVGDFCVKLFLRSKNDGFDWVLVSVYDAAQEEHKPQFLSELVRLYENETLPMMVGGDFNIIRKPEEKEQ